MKLIFQNNKGEEKVIAEPSNVEECYKEMYKFLKEHNYKSYYQNVYGIGYKVRIDFGSWSEFFIVEGITFTDFCNESKNKSQILHNKRDKHNLRLWLTNEYENNK